MSDQLHMLMLAEGIVWEISDMCNRIVKCGFALATDISAGTSDNGFVLPNKTAEGIGVYITSYRHAGNAQ